MGMEIEQAIIQRIDDWIPRARECVVEFDAYHQYHRFEQPASDKYNVLPHPCLQDLLDEGEFLAEECISMIRRFTDELNHLHTLSNDVRAAWKLLRSAQAILEYEPYENGPSSS